MSKRTYSFPSAPKADTYELRYELGPNGFPLGHYIATDADGKPCLKAYELGTSVGWFEQQLAERGIDLDSDDEDEPDPELEDNDAELDIDIDYEDDLQ